MSGTARAKEIPPSPHQPCPYNVIEEASCSDMVSSPLAVDVDFKGMITRQVGLTIGNEVGSHARHYTYHHHNCMY